MKIIPGLLGQALEAAGVGRGHSGCRFDFNAPSLAPLGEHTIHFHLVLIPVMPQTRLGRLESGLNVELLDGERFQQMTKCAAVLHPHFV